MLQYFARYLKRKEKRNRYQNRRRAFFGNCIGPEANDFYDRNKHFRAMIECADAVRRCNQNRQAKAASFEDKFIRKDFFAFLCSSQNRISRSFASYPARLIGDVLIRAIKSFEAIPIDLNAHKRREVRL